MRAVGLVVEYNPFHNGHLYHLESARETTGADIVIAVMSGNFLQRGEPALVSKWERAKMALMNGVDLVFELPYKYTVQKAEVFASGAVAILDAAGCDSLCFGSESGDITSFLSTVEFLGNGRMDYDGLVQKHIKSGVSYPRAAALALAELETPAGLVPLSKPNNILGYHYVKAIRDQGSSMEPVTVKRKNANYHDEDFASATIASATSIRKALFSEGGEVPRIQQFVPGYTADGLIDYIRSFGNLHNWEMYFPFLKYKLLCSSPDEIQEIYEAEEGLENRLIDCAKKAATFQEFMELAKTKRYTWTRIQRFCTHILINAKKEEMAGFMEGPEYLRLLGMTSNGRDYLNKKKSGLAKPLISKLSSYKGSNINLDIRASSIYSMGLGNGPGQFLLEMEYRQPPLMIEKR